MDLINKKGMYVLLIHSFFFIDKIVFIIKYNLLWEVEIYLHLD
jgi:hypothetical protein